MWRYMTYYALYFWGLGGLYPLLPLYMDHIGIHGTEFGEIMALGPFVGIVFQPFWGMISDRYQAGKRVLRITLACSAVLALLMMNARSVEWLFILYAGLMLFQSAIVPISDSFTLAYVTETRRDYGKIRLWGSLGFAAAAYVTSRLAEMSSLGLRVIFLTYFVCLAGCLFLTGGLSAVSGSVVREGFLKGARQLRTIRMYWIFLLMVFFLYSPMSVNNSFFSLLYTHLGGDLSGVGLAFLLFAGSEAPLMLFAGPLIRRMGVERVLLVSGLISAIRWLFYAIGPNPIWIVCTFFIQGLSLGLFLPAAAVFVRKETPESVQFTSQSLYNAAGNGAGVIVMSYLGGVIMQHFSITGTYFYFAISSLIGWVIFGAALRFFGKKGYSNLTDA